MPNKTTNAQIDNLLIGRNILRVGDYEKSETGIIDFECLICQYPWKRHALAIAKGRKTGCPNCAGNAKLTNDIIDFRLKSQNIPIRRVGDVVNARKPMYWECLDCLLIWPTKADHILNSKSGCKACAGNMQLTNEIIDERLKNRSIARLDNYSGSCKENHRFLCLKPKCCNIWFKHLSFILGGGGCPECGVGKNERMVRYILAINNISFNYQKYINQIILGEKENIRVDFYLPNINTIIEYNGAQHYKPTRFGGMTKEKAEIAFIKQQNRDKYLQKFCDNNSIKLIWINGLKYFNTRLEKYLENELIPSII